MKTIENYDVRIFTDNIEESAIEQIKALLSSAHTFGLQLSRRTVCRLATEVYRDVFASQRID